MYRQIDLQWSTISRLNANVDLRYRETPHSATARSPSVPTCVSLPQQPLPTSVIVPDRKQVVLICSFDSSLSTDNPAYLLRIYNDGSRLVDKQLHSTTYAATSLLYDVSFNVVYWTVFATWTYPFEPGKNKMDVLR